MPEEIPNLAIYRDLVNRFYKDKVKGKANPYTSMNGNMYSFLDKSGCICIRISDQDRTCFATAFSAGPVVQHGAIMQEYVAVLQSALNSPGELENAFRASLQYAQSLRKK